MFNYNDVDISRRTLCEQDVDKSIIAAEITSIVEIK